MVYNQICLIQELNNFNLSLLALKAENNSEKAFVLGSKILMNKGNAASARTKSAEGTSAAKRLMFW